MRLPKIKLPTCPFCGRPIEKPKSLPIGYSDFEGGVCECGSVYVCDVTGKNRGAAFVEALLIACGGNWDLAWDLSPEEDYVDIWIEDYDYQSHKIVEWHPTNYRPKGVLCFIKLSRDIEELREAGLKKALKKESKHKLPPKKKKLKRQEIELLIKEEKFEELLSYHLGEPINFYIFQKVLYSPDEVLRKKAGVYLGLIAKELMDVYPEKILDLIKRLLYASADSAASPWGAIEAVGEILRNTEDRYSIFIKNLFAFLSYPEYLLPVLYALYRISETNPKLIKSVPYLKLIEILQTHPNPEVKALICFILKNIKAREILSYLPTTGSAQIFDYKKMDYQTIALDKLTETIKKELS